MLLLLVAAFIIGYLQGTIRRLLGIAAVLFSFVLAAYLRDPFGNFLASNWTQFPPSYSHMIAFALVREMGKANRTGSGLPRVADERSA